MALLLVITPTGEINAHHIINRCLVSPTSGSTHWYGVGNCSSLTWILTSSTHSLLFLINDDPNRLWNLPVFFIVVAGPSPLTTTSDHYWPSPLTTTDHQIWPLLTIIIDHYWIPLLTTSGRYHCSVPVTNTDGHYWPSQLTTTDHQQ